MKIYDYRIRIKEEEQEQKDLTPRFQEFLEAAVEKRKIHLERRERFEQELIPLMKELARRQRGVLYLDVQSRRGCARILLEGMLVLGRYDADLMQALLPYEIMIYARDEVLLLEVWVEFWDIA